MTERRAYILLFVAALLAEAVLMGGLALLGAENDLLVAVYLLLVCAAGLGVGLIGTHDH